LGWVAAHLSKEENPVGLPEEKAREVVDFARFLQLQSGDREWERILAEKRTYPKLEKFAAESLREGKAVLF
jgi:hypothetical protein